MGSVDPTVKVMGTRRMGLRKATDLYFTKQRYSFLTYMVFLRYIRLRFPILVINARKMSTIG